MAIAVMAALVFASVTAGIAIDRVVLRTRMNGPILPDTSFHPMTSILRSPTAADRQRVRAQLANELSLTPAQVPTVDSILDAHTLEFQNLREEIRPRVEQLTAGVRADVERVLTPTQRERYRHLLGQGSDPGRDSTRPRR
jgi:hypothetical protein